MLVARSYSYGSSSRSPSPPKRNNKTNLPQRDASPVRGFGWRPESFKKTQAQTSQSMTSVETKDSMSSKKSDASEPKDSDSRDRAISQSLKPSVPQSTSPPHSKPVAVPFSSHGKRTVRENDSRRKSSSKTEITEAAGSEKLSPAAAALLASTSIPKRKTFPRPRARPTPTRKISIDELVQEWKKPDSLDPSSLSSSPTMDLLLSPPEEHKELQFLNEDQDEDDMAPFSESMPSRSISSTSVRSLGIDDSSSLPSSTPTTPYSFLHRSKGASSAASRPMQRKRSISLSQSVDSAQDHPLRRTETAPDNLSDAEEQDESDEHTHLTSTSSRDTHLSSSPSPSRSSSTSSRHLHSPPPTTKKSNLTTSLQSLRSTLTRSFANFAAPPRILLPSHDDLALARGFGLISSSPPTAYNPEMRPRPLDGLPSPEMRRYLNPHAFHLFENKLDGDVSPRTSSNLPNAIGTSSLSTTSSSSNTTALITADSPIPLQPYRLSPPPSPSTLSSSPSPSPPHTPPANSEANPLTYNHTQRREPRENPEFLRIALLEMAMRRAGKLEGGGLFFGAGGAGAGAAGGRRSWWLPAREVSAMSNVRDGAGDDDGGDEDAAVGMGRSKVPRRWVGEVP